MYEIQKYLGCVTDNIILTWNDIWDKIDIVDNEIDATIRCIALSEYYVGEKFRVVNIADSKVITECFTQQKKGAF